MIFLLNIIQKKHRIVSIVFFKCFNTHTHTHLHEKTKVLSWSFCWVPRMQRNSLPKRVCILSSSYFGAKMQNIQTNCFFFVSSYEILFPNKHQVVKLGKQNLGKWKIFLRIKKQTKPWKIIFFIFFFSLFYVLQI